MILVAFMTLAFSKLNTGASLLDSWVLKSLFRLNVLIMVVSHAFLNVLSVGLLLSLLKGIHVRELVADVKQRAGDNDHH